MTFAGISFVTMLPAPITVLSPIVTPESTVTFPPNQTLLPTVIGCAVSLPVILLAAFIGCSAV